MRGLLALFLAVVLFGVCWNYTSDYVRNTVRRVVRDNIIIFAIAAILVAGAVFFSINSTVRLV